MYGEVSGANPTRPAGSSARVATCSGFSLKVDPLLDTQAWLSIIIHFDVLTFRCVLQCQDEVKDKVNQENITIVNFCCSNYHAPTTIWTNINITDSVIVLRLAQTLRSQRWENSEGNLRVVPSPAVTSICSNSFETSWHSLSRSIAKMPNLLIKLKDAFESGKL